MFVSICWRSLSDEQRRCLNDLGIDQGYTVYFRKLGRLTDSTLAAEYDNRRERGLSTSSTICTLAADLERHPKTIARRLRDLAANPTIRRSA